MQRLEEEQNLEQFTIDFTGDVDGETPVEKEERKTMMQKLHKNMNPCKISVTGRLQLQFAADTPRGKHPKNMFSFFRNNQGLALAELQAEFNEHEKQEHVANVFTTENMKSIGAVVQSNNELIDVVDEAEKRTVRGTIIFEVSKKLMEIQAGQNGPEDDFLTIGELGTIFVRLMQICKFAKV